MNLSYCRWENTLADLEDCFDHIDETMDLSIEEAKCRFRLIQLCIKIAQNYEEYEEPSQRETPDEDGGGYL